LYRTSCFLGLLIIIIIISGCPKNPSSHPRQTDPSPIKTSASGEDVSVQDERSVKIPSESGEDVSVQVERSVKIPSESGEDVSVQVEPSVKPPSESDILRKEAKEHFTGHRYDEAISTYKKGLLINPG